MSEPAKKTTFSTGTSLKKNESMINAIKDRQAEELVIALCGAVGSGTSTIAKKLKELFHDYNYDTEIIKVSKLIEKHIEYVIEDLKTDDYLNNVFVSKIDCTKKIDDLDLGDRIALLQSAGNLLRQKTSKDILAQLSIKEIALKRDSEASTDDQDSKPVNEKNPRRHVTIIDSLKNPKEVELLQLIYKDMFYLFGVLCPEDIRRYRLIGQKKIDETKITQLMIRDKSEGEKHGQKFLDTILHSDFFVTNSMVNIDSLRPHLDRFIKIMMGRTSITPTIEENAMYHAQSAAAKSGCLSKQVGAAIIDEFGNLLSTGCNDVPKGGGGLYTIEDNEDDSRCMFQFGGKCINQDRKNDIFNEIDEMLEKKEHDIRSNAKKHSIDNTSFLTEVETVFKQIGKEVRSHKRLKNLIEFCRAIHAEMDAITSAARNGVVSLKNSYLFSTTFPCHNCARHIIATGISRVYYIEPYEKSLALSLHEDAITLDTSKSYTKDKKVQFIPFEGVSPKKYLKLFLSDDRKKDGARKKYDPKNSKPSIPALLDIRYDYETKVVDNLEYIGFKG